MDHQFPDDQERHGQEQARMDIEVVEKRQRDTSGPGTPFDDRQ